MNSNRLPQTDSIQQLAEFWDTHDVTDFEDDLEEVTESVFDLKKTVMVQLTHEDAEVVKKRLRRRKASTTPNLSANGLSKRSTAFESLSAN